MIMIYDRHVAATQDNLKANQNTALCGREKSKASEEEDVTATLLLILNILEFKLCQLLNRHKKYSSAYINRIVK